MAPSTRSDPQNGTILVPIPIPRDALIVRAEPDFVSQSTCEQLFGIKRRAYLDTLIPALAANGVPVIRVGKARLVPRAAAVAYLLSQAVATTTTQEPPDEIEEILAHAGTVRR